MSDKKDEVTRLNPIARAVLQGLYDPESPLHKLQGMHLILKAIWKNVVDHWKARITQNFEERGFCWSLNFLKLGTRLSAGIHDESEFVIQFPEPKDININMMPFVMSLSFKESKLPKYLSNYWDEMIQYCINFKEMGKIGYLTIQESHVEEGLSQRRPGIHTESPGVCMLQDGKGNMGTIFTSWAGGAIRNEFILEGGIYMASNVENSCRVWDCQILRPEVDSLDIVGKHGDIEHLREFLPPESQVMKANVLYWITDRTPHESLPLRKGTYRQFFRLVTSRVGLWFADHSTKNPLGAVPDSKITKIVTGSKFDGVCCVVDP